MARMCRLTCISACLWLVLGAFGTASGALSPPSSNVVTFTASDHRFKGPDQLPAGQTTVRLHNKGKDPHQLQFLKLEPGKTAADLAAALKAGGGVVPPWAKHMGGPNGVDAGRTSEATLYLEPGSYVIICGVPGKNHQTHAAVGMQKTLTITDTSPPPPEFSGNFHMAMFDYEFVVVQPLRRGRHSFYVINRGHQVHQVSFVRLNRGASTEDLLKAVSRDEPSPLPGKLIGGMSGLEPGRDG
ncbi:MAG TPA: hypothetical protein VLA47_00945, partial [Nitrospira sp.]|nr:hypothetical protein [Nitrospira sp.]